MRADDRRRRRRGRHGVDLRRERQVGGVEHDLALALADGGYVVGWHQATDVAAVEVFARRYDEQDGWSHVEALDAEHPAVVERMRLVDAVDDGGARAVWRRQGEDMGTSVSAYGCHVPGEGWSAAQMIFGEVERYEARGGDVLVVTRAYDVHTAEYFTALP